jgi:preprotein translocase subunit SecY
MRSKQLIDALGRPDLPGRIVVTATCLAVWRTLAIAPVPAIDLHGARPTEATSVVALGLDPYVFGFVVIFVLRMVSSTFNDAIREGATAHYWRWELLFTAVFAALAARARIEYWQTGTPTLLPTDLDPAAGLGTVLVLTGGALALYGLGRLMSEYGIGFAGHSTGPLLLYALDILGRHGADFVGALAVRLPTAGSIEYARYGLGLALAVVLVALTVAMSRAVRTIPVRTGGSGRQGGTRRRLMPVRLLTAGVLAPVILANGVVYAPETLAEVLRTSPSADVRHAAAFVAANWRPDGPLPAMDAAYLAVHAALIVALATMFARFWIDPHDIARELQKLGAVLPGLRPGDATGRYLGRVLVRLSFVGGVFLAIEAVIAPVLGAWVTGIPSREALFDGFAIMLAASMALTAVRDLEEAPRTAEA